MKSSYFVSTMVVSIGLMVAHVSANTMFNDNFTGGASANWANPSVATYTNDNAYVPGASDPERNYVYTVDEDYATGNFVATADLTNGNTRYGIVFFGMGEGTPSPNAPGYWEPKNGSYVYGRFNGDNTTIPWVIDMGSIDSDVDPKHVNYGEVEELEGGTTVRMELSWEAATSTATFKIDTDYDGVYDVFPVPLTNTGLSEPGAISRLFFGGAGVTVDNFSVVFDSSHLVPGDANGSGTVDEADAAILASNWLTQSMANWPMGDFNDDGKVDDIDATILASNWGTGAAASVPEPSTFVFLIMGLLGMFVIRWRK